MAWTTDFLHGFARHLHDVGVGQWAPDEPIAGLVTPIVIGGLPEKPDRVIALAEYVVASDDGPNRTHGLQVRCRAGGLVTDVADLADQVYDTLHGLEQVRFGVVPIALVWRQSHMTSRDGERRWETTSNYYTRTAQGAPTP